MGAILKRFKNKVCNVAIAQSGRGEVYTVEVLDVDEYGGVLCRNLYTGETVCFNVTSTLFVSITGVLPKDVKRIQQEIEILKEEGRL